MYTGTNKTALTSQNHIAEAFIELLRLQSYASISISAICKAAGVSRQTFYSLFESKENIILYELSQKHSFQPGQTCCQSQMSLDQLCLEYSHYIIEKRELLTLLVKNDILYLMNQCLFDSIMSCACFQPNTDLCQKEYIAEFFSGGLAGIAKTYVKQGAVMTPEQLHKIIYGLFSSTAFQ